MKKIILTIIGLLLVSSVVAVTMTQVVTVTIVSFIESYSNDIDTIYGDKDNQVNFTTRWQGAEYVMANFDNVDESSKNKTVGCRKISLTQHICEYSIGKSVSDGIYSVSVGPSKYSMVNDSLNITIDKTSPNIERPSNKQPFQFPSVVFEYTDVRLDYNVTDKNGLSEVLILGNWEGSWRNYTADGNLSGGTFTYLVDSSYLESGEKIEWKYYAKDKANNYRNGYLRDFRVKNRTQIILDPEEPNGKNGYYITLPLIILKADETANNTYYRWNSLALQKYTSPFYFDWNETFGGIETIRFFSEFNTSSTVNETSQNKTIKVDITKPRIEDVYPVNDSLITKSLVNISALLNDVYESNSGINESSVVMKVDNVEVSLTISEISKQKTIVWYETSLINGWYDVYLYVEDNAGLSNYLNWSFLVNTSSFFDINIISPINGTYNEKRLLLELSLGKEADELFYKTDKKFRRLCRDCKDYSKKKRFDQGNNTLTIRAVDEFGNYNERNIEFFVDSKEPRIRSVNPKRGFANGTFLIRYKEENLKEVRMYYRNNIVGKTDCLSGKREECLFTVDLSGYEGEKVSFFFELEDVAGNKDASRNYEIVVNTVPSLITVNEPINKVYNRYVIFNVSLDSEASLKYVEDGRERRLCRNCDEYGVSKVKKKRFSKGVHNITIFSEDKSGNRDEWNVGFEVV